MHRDVEGYASYVAKNYKLLEDKTIVHRDSKDEQRDKVDSQRQKTGLEVYQT